MANDNNKSKPVPEGEMQVSLFKSKEIRRVLHEGEWKFSIVDIIEAVVDTAFPSRYWAELRDNLIKKEGFTNLFDKIEKVKMPGKDGKEYPTEACGAETVFRIIQSIPSPKAEPFKRWLAKTAYERIEEFQNPEIAIKRAMLDYEIQGRSDEWIKARVRTILSRTELTDEWKKRGVEGLQYGVLTNVISKETFDINTTEHKEIKGLAKKDSLRDHMTDMELVLTMLGETSTAELARVRNAQGFEENKDAAHSGGKIAGDARKNFEKQLGKPVVSKTNFLPKKIEHPKLKEG
jgi:DNA-damage-inducible protein D